MDFYILMVSFWIANESFLPKNFAASKHIKYKALNMKPGRMLIGVEKYIFVRKSSKVMWGSDGTSIDYQVEI